jgi:hypothetical protein
MKLGYKCLDPVHRELAAQLAGEWGLEVEFLEPRDAPTGEIQDVLIDLDAWPTGCEIPCPWCRGGVIAVHGYGLDFDAIERLGRRGVIAAPRLDRALVLRVYQGIIARRGAAREAA